MPEGSRWTITQRQGLFRNTAQSAAAIEAYHKIAEKHGLSLAQMALAYVYQFRGITSTIIGATSIVQLDENIGAYELELSDEAKQEIGEVIQRYPVPF